MFGPPASPAIAGIESLVIAGFLLALGYLIADALVQDRAVERTTIAGLALVALCGFALVLMGVHIVTRGWFFSEPLAVRVVTGVVAVVALVARLRRGPRPGNRAGDWLAVGLAVAGIVVWCSPVFRMLPLTATADTQLHNGWIHQLMNGHTMPGAVLSGDVPNYYPWLFHALGTVATYLMPGRNAYYALGPLQIVVVVGNLLALFALGRALWNRLSAGFGAALLGGLAGGIGFLLAGGPALVTDPRADAGEAALDFGGDLLFARPYSVGMHQLAPPFPRDLAFALLAGALLLLVLALARSSWWSYAAAGAGLALVGLTGGESFFVGLFAAVLALAVAPSQTPRVRRFLYFLGPLLLIYALWAVPVIVNYARLGGFVDITHIDPIDLPLWAVGGAWGVTSVLAFVGLGRTFGHRPLSRGTRVVVGYAVAACALLIVAGAIPEVLGDAFDTLGRRHRYWPLVHLGVALIGAAGVAVIADHLRGWLRGAALTVTAALAIGSPLAASLALPEKIGRYLVLERALEDDRRSVLQVVDRGGAADCIVAAPQSIAREVFSYTGYRLVLWTGNWYGANRARIRWADIYDHIAPEELRIRENRILVNGWGDEARWRSIAERYGVDIVVTPADHRLYSPFRGFRRTLTSSGFVVVQVGQCAP